MLRFAPSLYSDGSVRFIPAANSINAAGDTLTTYATPYSTSGVALDANVQFKPPAWHTVSDGVDRWLQEVTVCLFDDPTSLNGGLGVRRMDAFWWSLDGRLLICQGDAIKLRTLWRVLCLATQ